MAGERIICVPPKDSKLFQKFQAEVGSLQSLSVVEATGADHWYNGDLKSSEMAVRGVVRGAALERLGYKPEERWITDEEDIAGSLDSYPETQAILGEPDFVHYKWQNVSAKNLGSFNEIQTTASLGPLIDVKRGLVLFADEVQQLARGKVVVTLHSSGFETGFVAERKEAYKVVEGNLQRVRGLITD